MQINSKSFNNYLSARERAASKAKIYAERMNKIALERVKRTKMAEKAAKDVRADRVDK